MKKSSNNSFLKISQIIMAFGMINLSALSAFSQNSPANTKIDFNKCSGQISDLNCYKHIIKDVAQNGAQTPFNYNYNGSHGPYNKNYKNPKFLNIQGQKIILDTHDEKACQEVGQLLSNREFEQGRKSIQLNQLCQSDKTNPQDRYREITVMWETEEKYVTPLKNEFFKSTDNTLGNHTRNLSLMMVGTMGLLWMLPGSVTKWDKEKIKEEGFLTEYKRNIKAGPVIDGDDPVFNYIGHPISGAIYYTIARNTGYSRLESFGYSVLMSTFFWEYGFEAVAEVPSIQDLIITPVIGSLMGEMFYQWSENIKANGGKVIGSKKVGKVALFLLSPAETLSKEINVFLGTKFIQNSKTNLVLSRTRPSHIPGHTGSNYIGLELQFNFW